MVDVKKLRSKMLECDLNVEKMAKIMNIDRATLYRKLNADGENFTIKEADLIVRTLNLTKEEANLSFFSQFVA